MAEGAFGRSDAEIDLLVRGMRSGIAVVGFGYIGTVIGAVLADRGWPVTGIDVRQSVVDEINLGKTTVPEPGLGELVSNNVRVGRLRATTDFGAVAENDFVIVTVGTPLGPDYEPIVDDIKAAARAVGEHLRPGHLIILKSTVPPDTTEKLVLADPRRDLGAAGRGRLRVGVLPRTARRRPSHPRAVVDPRSSSAPSMSAALAPAPHCGDMPWEWSPSSSRIRGRPRWSSLRTTSGSTSTSRSRTNWPRCATGSTWTRSRSSTRPTRCRRAATTSNILMPSMGVGGYCLTKDPWFVNHLGQSLGFGPGNSADVEDCQRHDARLHLRAAQAASRRSGQGDRDQQDRGAGHRVQEQHRRLPAHAHQVRQSPCSRSPAATFRSMIRGWWARRPIR